MWSRYSFIGVRSVATADRARRPGGLAGRAAGRRAGPATRSAVLRRRSRLLRGARLRRALPPLTGGLVGFLVLRHRSAGSSGCRELAADDLHVPELGMMLATDLVVLDHFDGLGDAGRQRGPAGRRRPRPPRCAAYHQAIGRLDAMTTALSRPTPPMVSTVERLAAGRGRQPYRPEGLPEGGRGGQGGDPGRRVLPDRGGAALRAAAPTPTRSTSTGCCGRRIRARTCTCCGSTASTSSARRRRRTSRCSATGDRPGAAAPDRRHPLARGDAGGGRRARRRSCSPTRRSAPSTSCWSTWAATTWAGCASRARSRCRSSPPIERYSHVMHIVSTVVGELRDDRTRVRRAGRDASRPARCPGRPRSAPWRSSRSWSRPGAACTAASSATSASAATWTRRSRSVPR